MKLGKTKYPTGNNEALSRERLIDRVASAASEDNKAQDH
jgi:hypothetical protein